MPENVVPKLQNTIHELLCPDALMVKTVKNTGSADALLDVKIWILCCRIQLV